MPTVRPTISKVTVAFGLVSFPVDLLPATISKASKAAVASTSLVCPTCKAAGVDHKLKQQYACPHDASHGPFLKGDAARSAVIDGVMRPLDTATVDEIRQPHVERGVIELTLHPAAQVEEHTLTSGNIYRMRPKGNEAHYGLVLELVARNPEVAFLCEVTNKGSTLLYRMVAHAGVLTLFEVVRPDRIHEPEPIEVSFDPKLLTTGQALVDSLVEPFDPAAFVDRRQARLEALAAKYRALEPEPVDRSDAADTATDLLELLRRSVDAAAA